MIEKIKNFFLHPPRGVQVALWSALIALIIWVGLNSFGLFATRTVTLKFNFALQLIEVEVGPEKTQIPANIDIVDGHMYVNGIPIRNWLEQQGFTVIWDNEEQAAIAKLKK
jgi:hypothetical protein